MNFETAIGIFFATAALGILALFATIIIVTVVVTLRLT